MLVRNDCQNNQHGRDGICRNDGDGSGQDDADCAEDENEQCSDDDTEHDVFLLLVGRGANAPRLVCFTQNERKIRNTLVRYS